MSPYSQRQGLLTKATGPVKPRPLPLCQPHPLHHFLGHSRLTPAAGSLLWLFTLLSSDVTLSTRLPLTILCKSALPSGIPYCSFPHPQHLPSSYILQFLISCLSVCPFRLAYRLLSMLYSRTTSMGSCCRRCQRPECQDLDTQL